MAGAGGWYPDPSGVKGRYRYWDGDTWSDETTADPAHATAPVKAARDDSGQTGNRAWLVALAVLALITAIVVALLLRGTGSPFGGGHATEDTNSAKPTISAWDETSTPTPTTPPPPTQSGGVWVDCPVSTGVGNTKQTGGRLTAAGLSVAIPAGYTTDSDYISMAFDQHSAGRNIPYGQTYWSAVSVGLASNADGFVDISTTAMQLMQCNSMTYHPVDGPAPTVLIAGEPMTISGHPAWHVRWNIHYIDKPITGEILDAIAIDMGPEANYLGVYWSCRPENDSDFEASIASAINSLTVT